MILLTATPFILSKKTTFAEQIMRFVAVKICLAVTISRKLSQPVFVALVNKVVRL